VSQAFECRARRQTFWPQVTVLRCQISWRHSVPNVCRLTRGNIRRQMTLASCNTPAEPNDSSLKKGPFQEYFSEESKCDKHVLEGPNYKNYTREDPSGPL
jgi:hypothetical protein